MSYYKYYKYKGVHQYVCVDAVEDSSDDWMPYYTHRKYKAAHHYVHVDVF